ncbi:MAG: hypothetical protein A2469_04270 [Candidatus Magasanikbacteria bacterium RIFOXYC2_FULL_40_16]|uniref:PEGA domain-containing protein n=2 Tax=Candidatus Magasanikiibacteriota TaxID=1752731 RepID=A0A1F6NHL5_9BACT|nr:MAG: hypothetical protein A2373_00140 [Candidatus Magasanikbacteria bacterium RIFOXYB1_FULL_40_15]OGH86702.1 MAG: hypothetical protein A2301_00130 [Candidatus Magasanikbacteria bacterium RIFOXYB2_FULL_40_13]OGH89214.1 MAG: hypothetical protein A2469_04270 [Candidatus Magasanikbacteria bacterium RIFOXYC2_FULL_40_16]
MVYPDSYNDKRFRRIFFIALVVIFFTVAPVLILYSMGFRIDWENKKIIETGVVSIDIEPKEAQVYLNNIRITKSMPIRLTNRTPGTYNLKISLPGYKTWEKNIDIKSRQTTYIKNIILLKDSLPIAVNNSPNNIDLFLPSTDGKYILLSSVDGNVRNIELFNSETKSFLPIFNLPSNLDYKLEWSPFDNHILFTKFQKNTASLNILSADDPEKIENLTIPMREKDKFYYQWQKNSPIPTIFTNKDGKIFKFTINGDEYIFDLDSDIKWYIDELGKLWVFENNTLKIESEKDGQNSIPLSNISEIEKIIDINNNRAVVMTNGQAAIVSREENRQETINTSNFQRNPYTNEWLTWSSWELWSIYEHDKPALLNRTSDNIKSVFPLDEVGALTIINNQGITAFNPGYYVSQNLYNGEVYGASVNRQKKKIYLFGKVGSNVGLYELDY